jgi:hypothetical protein
MYDAAVIAAYVKNKHMRVRPSALSPRLVVSGSSPTTPSYVSERAVICAAAATVLRYLYPSARYPEVEPEIAAIVESAETADLWSGSQYRSDVLAGSRLGTRVGERVIESAAHDGAEKSRIPYLVSNVPGRWLPTSMDEAEASLAPLLPAWGRVRTWVLPSGSALRPSPPPVHGGAEWNLQMREVYEASKNLSVERRLIAERWAGGPGTETPAGSWNTIACRLGQEARLSDRHMARVLALLGIAQSDAFVACWDAKYAYDCCRPVTAIRETIDERWSPFLETPRFPSYPSGHATTSGAASQLLAYLFPKSAADLMRMGTEAKDSRFYGGIHTRCDNDAGMDLGRGIASAVIAVASKDGS